MKKTYQTPAMKVVRVEQRLLTDASLVSKAKAAAMKAKFSPKDDAPEVQTGTITYVFRNN